ncbi:MAG: M48 family metalloprotease [Bdellovibrio sp.]
MSKNPRLISQERAIEEFDLLLAEWNSTRVGRRTFLASMGLLLASCAAPEKTRFREGDNSGQNTQLTVNDERRMTQQVLPQMKKDYPALNNPEMQAYVSNLGQRIAAANKIEGNPYNYNFTVVDVGYVNAFALPAGTVFVTTPLIAMADNEAELAGVIGHEIGHIKARHTAERMEVAKREQASSWKYALGGGLLGGVLGYGLGRLACPPKDTACMQKATQLGAAAGAGGGLLVQKYGFMQNSQEDEMEADRIGFRTALNAGYDKDKIGTFYAKLLTMEKQRKTEGPAILQSVQDALSTHPPSQRRVDQMNEMASQTSRSPKAIVSTRDFDRMRALATKITSAKKTKA